MNTINPLANPKGVKLLCELCQKPAFVQCTDCRVTYYWWVVDPVSERFFNFYFYGFCYYNLNKLITIALAKNVYSTIPSSTEHQKADWLGIHEKICQLLIPLRTPIPFLGSEEERQHRKQQQIVRQVQALYLLKGSQCHMNLIVFYSDVIFRWNR